MHPTWTEQLSDDLKTEENYAIFDKYPKQSDFAKGFLENNGNLNKMRETITGYEGKITAFEDQAKAMVKKPTENSTPEEIRAYYGVPESVDDYGLEELAKDNKGKALLENFKNANLSPSQAKLMVQNLEKFSEAENASKKTAATEAVEKYKSTLGEKAEMVFKNAESAIKHFYPEASIEAIRAEIMSNPSLIEAHSKMGHILQESPGVFVGGGSNKGSGTIYETMKDLD